MKILWITNILLPITSKLLKKPLPVGGGWIRSLAYELVKNKSITLAIATVYEGKDLIRHQEDGILYFLLPQKKSKYKYDSSLERIWMEVCRQYEPDLVHIHGTEYAPGLACINACNDYKYVVSIQGLISVCHNYYYAGLSPIKLLGHLTLNEIRTVNPAFRGRMITYQRGKIELQYLRRCGHVIGRTFWDYSHVMSVNPELRYHFCNEALRPIFYSGPRWTLENKHDYTILLSQSYSPFKGLHQLLRAIKMVKRYFPRVQLRVAGNDITGGGKWIQRINSYGAYIRKLIKRLDLEDNVMFTGPLGDEAMAEEFRKAHICVIPSAIENSPNSLGEAQIMGTPCVASFVGGVPDMITDNVTGLLYRFDDHIVLAYKIMELIKNDELAQYISKNGIIDASKRHDRTKIVKRILDIYQEIKNE